MKLQKQLLGPCTKAFLPKEDLLVIDTDILLQRLILFDTFILKTIRFRELPSLIDAFGVDGLIDLLRSNALKLECGHMTTAETGNMQMQHSKPLPLGTFSFSIASPGDYKLSIGRYLTSIKKDTGLSQKEFIKLKSVIADNMLLPPEFAGSQTLAQLHEDIVSDSPMIKLLTAKKLQKRLQKEVTVDDFHIKLHAVNDNNYESETNIGATFGFTAEEIDHIIGSSLLALGGLNLRIEEMSNYNVITGFADDEIQIFGEKINFLIREILPNEYEHHMSRVCAISGVPQFSAGTGKIDVNKLLAIRESKECQEFRSWLQTLSDVPDKEIEERLGSVRSRIGNFLTPKTGKTLRFFLFTIASTIVGLVPGIGTAAGLALSGIDAFLVDRIFPSDGPVSFISNSYPSIFQS